MYLLVLNTRSFRHLFKDGPQIKVLSSGVYQKSAQISRKLSPEKLEHGFEIFACQEMVLGLVLSLCVDTNSEISRHATRLDIKPWRCTVV